MASVYFDGAELQELAHNLGKGASAFGHLARTAVRKTAKDIEANAKQIVPVDFGNLKNSIGTSDLRAMGTSGSIEAEISATTDYASYVEFGTSRMAPRAFMGPSLDRFSGPFEEAMAIIAERAAGGT